MRTGEQNKRRCFIGPIARFATRGVEYTRALATGTGDGTDRIRLCQPRLRLRLGRGIRFGAAAIASRRLEVETQWRRPHDREKKGLLCYVAKQCGGERNSLVSARTFEGKMKIEPGFYRVIVEQGRNSWGLICVTYNLDLAKEFVVIEYFELMWSCDDPGLNIPSSRQATFKEELRVLHLAASTYKGQRSVEKQQIEGKLKEAYGSNITVNFEDIRPKLPARA
jgi:hypothetical protein